MPIGAGGRGGGGRFECHLHLIAMRDEQLAPSRGASRTFDRQLVFVANRESVPNGNERRFVEKPPANGSNFQEQIAIAERPVIGNADHAGKDVRDFHRLCHRLNILPIQMDADDDGLHF